ncbi:RmlC-like cupins superfamily protein [Striga hermonthica]|uniref:RmlC-like cupins superfamily protein n=1 Tax=Striga hermonthica TaxID=68872 RepID=A0A9N7NSH5_STRHE|nr:RmlC-like cupins superfamily protein [Striga hermonthica]
MAATIFTPTLSLTANKSIRHLKTPNSTPRHYNKKWDVQAKRIEKPLEELYNVKVERKVSKDRLAELGVSKWSVWKTGKCKLPWDWHVDQLVYIEEGEVAVVPEGSEQYMKFNAGDLVRYPKWFEADLYFNGFYQERYSFRAYGDD